MAFVAGVFPFRIGRRPAGAELHCQFFERSAPCGDLTGPFDRFAGLNLMKDVLLTRETGEFHVAPSYLREGDGIGRNRKSDCIERQLRFIGPRRVALACGGCSRFVVEKYGPAIGGFIDAVDADVEFQST